MKDQENQNLPVENVDANAVDALSSELMETVTVEGGAEQLEALFDEKKEKEEEEGVLAKAAQEGLEVAAADGGAIDLTALDVNEQGATAAAGGGSAAINPAVAVGLGVVGVIGVAAAADDGGSSGGGSNNDDDDGGLNTNNQKFEMTVFSESAAVAEGDDGMRAITFTLELDATPKSTVDFSVAVTGGTANGDDVEIAAGVVTFEAGQTLQTVQILVKGDTVVEDDETVQITVSGKNLEESVTATGTIINDDDAPDGPDTPEVFTLTEATVTTVIPGAEGETPTKNVTYWGYNPHGHGEEGVDNTGESNTNNLTNEGPADGGVPVSEALSFLMTLAGEGGVNDLLGKFEDIGIALDEQDFPDFSNVQNLSVDISGDGSTSTLELNFINQNGEVADAIVELGAQYTGFVRDIFFDEEGNSRLFEVEVPVTTYVQDLDADSDGFGDETGYAVADLDVDGEVTDIEGDIVYQDVIVDADGEPVRVPVVLGATSDVVLTSQMPIVLTPSENNGGTEESGFTSADDNLIVVSRLGLLHQAYIDAGEGSNTLEIDTKGFYAQPKALLNIQTINIHNLPNVYTDDDGTSTYPDLSGDGVDRSIVDITRAVDLEELNIASADFDGLSGEGGVQNAFAGALTVAGIRNDADVTLDGYFGADVYLHYGLEQSVDAVNVTLRNVNFDNGELAIAHNSPTLNLISTGGGNVLEDSDLQANDRANLLNLNILGDASLYIGVTLEDAFAEGTPAVIDASGNTASVDLNMNNFGDELFFTGTAEGDDHLTATGGTRNATITGGNGNNEFTVSTSEDIVINVGEGDNELDASTDGDIDITAGSGNNEISASSSGGDDSELEDSVNVAVGDGNNNIEVSSSDDFTVTAGNGDNVIDVNGGSVSRYEITENDQGTIVVGDGNNQIDFLGGAVSITAGDGDNQMVGSASDLNISTGSGNNTITSLNNEKAQIQTQDGNDIVTVSGEDLSVNLGAGNDSLTVAGASGEGGAGGAANLVLVLDSSGSMGSGPGSDLQAQTDAVLALLDTLPAGTAVYVAWDASGSGFWGTKEDAAQIANDLAAGTISSGWSTTAYVNQVQDAITSPDGTYNNGGTNEVIFITDGANTGLTSEPDYIDFLVDNGVRANSIGIGLDANDPADVAVIDSFAYDGRADSDLDGLVAPTNAELGGLLDDLGQGILASSGSNAAEVVIDLGEGENTLILGDSDQLPQGLTALEGSSITGENITMIVNANSDLRAAELSGIEQVVLDNDDVGTTDPSAMNATLTLTDEQFMDIGAENFSVEGSIFYTYSQIEIIVTGDRSLTEMGADNLPRNIDLRLLVEDGATLEMTAEQLHTRVAPEGVSLVSDGNTDVLNGQVVITGGGVAFDPFNTSDTVRTDIDGTIYYGGSLSSDFGTPGDTFGVTVNSVLGGYDRPQDPESIVVLQIPAENFLGQTIGDVDTYHENVAIFGGVDVEFDGELRLGELQGESNGPFTIDFSDLEGEVINLTVDHFEQLAHGGAIYGNSNAGFDAEVLIHLAADDYDSSSTGSSDGIGWDEPDTQSLVSTGVARYIVTQIDGPRASSPEGSIGTIKLCDTVEDLETIGLRGNENDTLHIVDAAWIHAFEFQGEVQQKRDQDGNINSVATVGAIDANFEFEGGIAFVNIVHAEAGDDSPIEVAGISVENSAQMVINAEGPSALVEYLDLTDGLEALRMNGEGDLQVALDENPAQLDSIDASGVTGDFVMALSAETNELNQAELTDVDGIILGEGSSLNVTVDQALDIGAANIDADGGDLVLSELAGQELIIPAFDEDFESISAIVAEGQDVVLSATTDLTGLNELQLLASSSLTMTADQLVQLALSEAEVLGEGDITVTGLTQAHIDQLEGLDLSFITGDGGIHIVLAEDVAVPGSDDNDLNGASFDVGEFTLTLPEIELADGLSISGIAGSALAFTDLISADDDSIDASGFDVAQLIMQALLVGDRNIDFLFEGLPQSVEKVVNGDLSYLTPVDQEVSIDPTTTVTGSLAFNHPDASVELEDFTLNLGGGVEVNGSIVLSTVEAAEPLIPVYLQTVTINSTGTEANHLSGNEANIITGSITSQADASLQPAGNVDNNLLDVTINAEQAFILEGKVIFESVTGDDAVTTNDDDEAVAVLNVNGTADVSLGGIDTTDDDVDGAVVTNNGTGTLSLTIDAECIDADDALSFQGSNIALTIDGAVDLSDDDLSGVSSITLADGATLTITMEDADTIGAGNFFIESGDTADLNLVGLADEQFAIANYAEGISVELVSIADLPEVTLHPDTDLTGVGGLVVPEGTILNLTAAQFQQLENGMIVGEGAPATTNFTVNITDLTQADVENGFNLSGIAVDNLTVTATEDVNIPAPDGLDIGPSDLNGADIFIGGFTFALYEIQLADGLNITGEAGSTLEFTDLDRNDPADPPNDGDPTNDPSIVASGFNVERLLVQNLLVANENIDLLFRDLPEAVIKVIDDDLSVIELVDQTVEVTAGTTVPGYLVFNPPNNPLEDFTLNLQGGTLIDGNFRLSNQTDTVDNTNQILQYLASITINSNGDAANDLNGVEANVISGDLTTLGLGGLSEDNNNLNVIINAEQTFTLGGKIIFESVTDADDGTVDGDSNVGDGADGVTANDNEEAVAQLTINGSADVNLGGIDTTDIDVDGVVVTNNGTGTLSLTLAEDCIDQDAANDNVDSLSFLGGNIALTIDGVVDLSDDDISGVSQITIGEEATLTLTQAQLSALGVANLINGTTDPLTNADETLHLVEFGSDPFDATAVAPGINIASITMQEGDITLDPTTDLTGVGQINIPEGGTLNLTAAQYQQLAGSGTITIVNTDGVAANDTANINITDVTQAAIDNDLNGNGARDAGEGFSLANVAGGAQVTMTVIEDIVLNAADDLDELARLLVNLGDNLSLSLAHPDQADGLNVDGGVDSTLIFLFDDAGLGSLPGDDNIDASDYNVTTLRALNTFVNGQDIENILEDLPSAVTLVVYQNLAELLGVTAIDRVVVIEESVTVEDDPGTEGDGYIVVNDWDQDEAIRSLHLTMQGGSEIDGNLRLTTYTFAGGTMPLYLQELVIVSEGAAANTNTGSTDNVIDGDISAEPVFGGAAPSPIENNLLNVLIQATQDFVVTGDIVFTSVNGDTFPGATLTLEGDSDVTVSQLDVSDNEVSMFTIANNGTGVFTATGASPSIFDVHADASGTVPPGADATANLEVLNVTGTGDVILGTVGQGIDAAGLSTIDASGHSGLLNLGEVVDIDSENFSFLSGSGETHLNLTMDTLSAGPGDSGWSFDFSAAAPGSMLVLGAADFDEDFGGPGVGGEPLGNNINWAMGDLNINLGPNGVLYIAENTDWTGIDLSIMQTMPIMLGEGVELSLLAEQAHMLNIMADPAIELDSTEPGYDADAVPVVNISQLEDNVNYDFSGIQSEIAGTITLADNDVTVGMTADLGDFSVSLSVLSDSDTLLSGQIVRFWTEEQAAREIRIIDSNINDLWTAGDDSSGSDLINSTSVVWLMDSVAGPVETGAYSEFLGRLWINQALANGADVEDLFTTLPDSIVRVEFSELEALNALLSSADVDRIVELVSFTDLTPGGLVFSDGDRLENLRSLVLKAGGSVNGGDVFIGNVVDPVIGPDGEVDPTSIQFNSLTIESHRALHEDHFLAPEAFVNDNNGLNEAGEFAQPGLWNVFGDIGVGTTPDVDSGTGFGLDLLDVRLNTLGDATANEGNGDTGSVPATNGSNLMIGTITFDAESPNSSAVLFVEGDNITQIDSIDSTDPDITTVTVTNAGPGPLNVLGASPAGDLDNTETHVINATGDVTYGTAGDADKPGIAGEELSLLDINGVGDVTLNTIALVDSLDFTLDTSGSDGTVTATLGAATVGTPSLAAGGTWTLTNSGGGNPTPDLTVTLSDAVTLEGTLNLLNMDLVISGDVDFTTLEGFSYGGTGVDQSFIYVPAGSSLTLTAEQADGIVIYGDGAVTVTELEATPDADLGNIMTSDGDTGTLEAQVTTTAGTDVDFTGELGKANVVITGDGIFDVTGATLDTAAFDHDDDGNAVTADQIVRTTFEVGAGSTLELASDQLSDSAAVPPYARMVSGAGTTDLALFGAPDDVDLSNITTAVVNASVTSSEDFDMDANFGTAIITVSGGQVLDVIGQTVDGLTILGENATVRIDDADYDAVPGDDPIVGDFSGFAIENITFVADALLGAVTFPTLYGDPAAWDLDNTVPFQTVTMTARQATGQTIMGAGGNTEGRVIVNDLDGDNAYNLSLITVGRALAFVTDTPVTLDPATLLGGFSVQLDVSNVFTLSAAQADGTPIVDSNGSGDDIVTVTALEATPNADLSQIVADQEIALLDANDDVTLGANLGSNMEVRVSDSVPGVSNEVTFTGMMVSAATVFTIMSDDITLVFDAADAHQLEVAETAGGVANSAVVVNNLGEDLVDLSDIAADSKTANVPQDVDGVTTLDPATNLNGFVINLAEGADIQMSYAQFQQVGPNAALDVGDFSSAAGGDEELVIVEGFDPADLLDSSMHAGPGNDLALELRLDIANGAIQTFDLASDLSGVEEIVIPLGVTLNMTADQFQQIQTSMTVTGDGTLNLTGFDSDNADIDLSTVTANPGTISLDPAAGLTEIDAGTGELVAQAGSTPIILDGPNPGPEAVLDNNAGLPFSILMTANEQAITLSSETQADHPDGRIVSANGFADTRLLLGFDTADATDGDANVVATNYATDHVYIINTYLNNEFGGVTPANIESFLFDLDGGINVVVFDADTALANNLVAPTAVEGIDRTFIIEPNTFVDASVAFNDLRNGTEVRNLTVDLQGNAVVDGSLTIPQSTDPQTGLPTTFVTLLESLTINSYDLTGGLVSPNRINGQVMGNSALNGAESRVEEFTLELDPTLSIVGSQEQIFFDGSSIGFNDTDDVDDVGAALAAASYQNWSASYDAVTNTVTFVNVAAGDVTDVTLADFTFVQNDGSTVGFPGTASVTVTQQGVFEADENNLLDVTINASDASTASNGHSLTITGVLEFSYVEGSRTIVSGPLAVDDDRNETATLTINTDGGITVNIGAVDTSDEHITALAYTKNGAGTVNAPGTSPGAAVGDTEAFTIDQPDGGVTTFGTDGDLTRPGVAGDDLSELTVAGTGTVNLNTIAQVDGLDFTLDTSGFAGDVNAELRADMADGGVWTFDNSGDGDAGTAPLNLTISGTAGPDAFPADAVYGTSFGVGGTLILNEVNLSLEGDVDFSELATLTLINTPIVVEAGATLTLTVEQAQALASPITGEGTVEIVGEFNDDDIGDPIGPFIQTAFVDISAVTLGGAALFTELTLDGADTDSVAGVDAGQTVTGSAFADLIVSSAEDDSISSGEGDDTIGSVTGGDTINGGDDTDTVLLDGDYGPVGDAGLEGVENVTQISAGGHVIDLSDQADESFNVTLGNGGDLLTLANGDDTVTGGDLVDIVFAGEGNDSVTGGDGGDLLLGEGGEDTLIGGAGADDLVGGTGDDTLIGEDTDNTIDGDDSVLGPDTADGAADVLLIQGDTFDDDNLVGIGGVDANLANVEIVNAMPADSVVGSGIDLDGQTEGFEINGSDDDGDALTTLVGQDTLTGGAGDDTINGLSGDDTIRGNVGADALSGGDGDDTFQFADGAELAADATVDGGAGVDTIEMDNSTLVSSDFADVINMEAVLFSNAGADHEITLGAETDAAFANGITITAAAASPGLDVYGSSSTVAITATGTDNSDTLVGGSADDSLSGGAGIDLITGGAGADTLEGGAGDDVINGSDEDALIDGGADNDVLQTDGNFDDANLNGGVDQDLALVGVEIVDMTDDEGSSLNLSNQLEGFEIIGTDDDGDDTTPANGRDTITGSQGDDSVSAGSGNDSVTGGLGNDTLEGDDGNDTLIGGEGDDTLTGGAGSDVFEFVADATAETDTITDYGNDEGADELSGELGTGDQLNVTFGTLSGVAVQGAPTTGTSGTSATVTFAESYDVGDVVSITIQDSQAVNPDLVISRTVTAGATSGFAVAQDFEQFLNSINLTNTDADLGGGGIGNSDAQALGGAGQGILTINDVNAGDDVVTITTAISEANGILFDAFVGGAGIAQTNGVVSVTGSTGDDTITGGVNGDTISGGTGLDEIEGLAGNDSLSGDGGADTILGGAGEDTIIGGGNNDSLVGGADNDSIEGSIGDDTLVGGTGSDTLTGGDGLDVFVLDEFAAADTITDFVAADDTLHVDIGGLNILTTGGATVVATTGFSALGVDLFTAASLTALQSAWTGADGNPTTQNAIGFTNGSNRFFLGTGVNSTAVNGVFTLATLTGLTGAFTAADVFYV